MIIPTFLPIPLYAPPPISLTVSSPGIDHTLDMPFMLAACVICAVGIVCIIMTIWGMGK